MRWSKIARWLAFLAMVSAGLVAMPSAAREAIFASSCFLPAEQRLDYRGATNDPRWECGARPGTTEVAHGWLRYDGFSADAPAEDVQLESDNAAFDGLLTVVTFNDGSQRTRYWSAEALARHWTTGTRFSIPLYSADDRPTELLMRIDRPFSRNVAVQAELVSTSEATAARRQGLLLFGVLSGMLLLSMVYSVGMAFGLRQMVTVYHAAITALIGLYTLASSSLLFAIFPGATLWLRTDLSYFSMALAGSLLAPFAFKFLEHGVIDPPARHVMLLSSAILAGISLLVPLLGPVVPFLPRQIFHLAYLPAFLAYGLVIVSALRNGSKAVWFLLIAWTLPVVTGVDRVLRGMDVYSLPHTADFAFFVAVALEAVVIAIGVAWRIVNMRHERDRALAIRSELSRQATTDQLTGLPNRRAFEGSHWREGDYLAIIDVDHFKRINDGYGHQVGDTVLRLIGRQLASELGCKELVSAWRLGGEEFAVLVAAKRVERAAQVINSVRERLSTIVGGQVPEFPAPLTVSAGLARIGPRGIMHAFRAADRVLYHAKASGRDRLCYEGQSLEIATIFPRPKAA